MEYKSATLKKQKQKQPKQNTQIGKHTKKQTTLNIKQHKTKAENQNKTKKHKINKQTTQHTTK